MIWVITVPFKLVDTIHVRKVRTRMARRKDGSFDVSNPGVARRGLPSTIFQCIDHRHGRSEVGARAHLQHLVTNPEAEP